ncbi:MAG TPA: hypothetical protein PKV96_01885 [Candidatus Saccharimonas sp.]|jgi:hypothetical protein|nr:hypothetical protein [Candidatus Saccharimonas sp.]
MKKVLQLYRQSIFHKEEVSHVLAAIGIFAVILISISDLSYVKAIWRRQAQPHRYTWFIFLMTALVIFWSQFALGSRDSLFVFGWFVVVNLTIFCLSLTRGRGVGGLDWPNSIALIVALASITLWFTMSSALMALICILVADTIGITLSLIKTWRDPSSEPLMMWGLGSVATALNVAAVGSPEWFLYLAPIHLFLCDVLMATTIMVRRKMVSVSDS